VAKKNANEDMFLTFLIKEKELAYVEKNHAQSTIRYMGKCLDDNYYNAPFIKRLLSDVRDFFMYFVMKHKERKNYNSIKDLNEKDKEDKIYKHKVINENDFKIHFFLIRKFVEKKLADDSCVIDISNFEYSSYLRIEYAETICQKHYNENFNNLNDAQKHYDMILNENKNKKVKNIIYSLTEDIDNKIKELNERINFFEKELK